MDITDVANYSTTNSQSQLMYQVGVAVTKMSMDTAQQMGDGMVKMMEQSVNPNLGSHFDMRL